MQVKVLKPWTGTRQNQVGDIINIPDNLVKEFIEGGWVTPVENKLMPPPSENKTESSRPRRKIKHRKKAAKK